jgi:hypothetical protein
VAGCGVFGRDEGGSEFSFSQLHVDVLLEKWSQMVRAVGWNATSKPTADSIMCVELCISDVVKPLLLANPSFIPYLVDALLLVRTTTTYTAAVCLYLRYFHVSRFFRHTHSLTAVT